MTPRSTQDWVQAVQAALRPLADAERAGPMRAYMKDQFPFLGVATPARRQAVAFLGREWDGDILAVAQSLWALPEREYQYVACDLLRQHVQGLMDTDLSILYLLILDKSWWDTVDSLAVTVGALVQQYPRLIAQMDEWIANPNLWIRRVALLHQLAWKSETDQDRLFGYCLRRAGDTDFFIRKAIGWALRQYARENPTAVARFIRSHENQLSGLSIREAMKHLKGEP
ncbi:MAG: DNA alkylation repair protein [Burkholderiales bacterium]|nr:DNA alkylation repair protein [Burkholderiales bacterium]